MDALNQNGTVRSSGACDPAGIHISSYWFADTSSPATEIVTCVTADIYGDGECCIDHGYGE
jgi:hypothetical protein